MRQMNRYTCNVIFCDNEYSRSMLCDYQQDKKTMGPPPGFVIFADVIVSSLHISGSSLVFKSVKKAYKEHENIIDLNF